MTALPSIRSPKAFTIAELLIATAIILLTSLAILFSYVQCLELNTINKDTMAVLEQARNTVEAIKSTPFGEIYDAYNKKIVALKDPEGIAIVEVDNKNPQLLSVSVKCFWKTKNRMVGEDKNLNGILDKDEDKNENGKLDSPITLFTDIAKR
jgi:type II secretory pathway pseudopilin PulG